MSFLALFQVSPLYQNVLALLPVIDALVSQDHFTPHIDPSSHTVAQFRNLWLLCTMFGFLSPQSKVTDWQRSALQSIAIKTPCLIRGTALNFVDHDLEYNSVLRKDYPGIVSSEFHLIDIKITTYRLDVA
jgi:phosphatidylinositol 4-kinase